LISQNVFCVSLHKKIIFVFISRDTLILCVNSHTTKFMLKQKKIMLRSRPNGNYSRVSARSLTTDFKVPSKPKVVPHVQHAPFRASHAPLHVRSNFIVFCSLAQTTVLFVSCHFPNYKHKDKKKSERHSKKEVVSHRYCPRGDS